MYHSGSTVSELQPGHSQEVSAEKGKMHKADLLRFDVSQNTLQICMYSIQHTHYYIRV